MINRLRGYTTVCGLVLTAALAVRADESWDAVYVGGHKVGHIHIQVKPFNHQGRDLVNVRMNIVQTFKRGRDRVTMEVRYGTIETPEGSVLKLETLLRASDNEIQTKGDVLDNGQMLLSLKGGGQQQELKIPWGDDVRGPYGAELSLSRKPMQVGEKRTIKVFVPELNKICLFHLEAKKRESVELGKGSANKELLRVEQVVTDLDGKPATGMDQTFWADDRGQVLKAYSDLLGGTLVYRTTKTAALAPDGDFDLLGSSILKIKRKIPDAEHKRDIVYRLVMKDDDPLKVIPQDHRQSLKDSGKGTATLEVQTDSLQTGPAGPDSVSDEFLRPNPLVNSDDNEVKAITAQAIGKRSDPWEKAVAIQDWVFQHMQRKNFEIGFAPASEVARNLTGDCTEHGVLTAAMCRAAGIPTRCVVGLVYAEKLGGFGPHLWNEVYVNRRWVAIDSTFNESEVDATHIKLAETSLDGVAPFEAFLPVIKIWNKLTIEPVEIR